MADEAVTEQIQALQVDEGKKVQWKTLNGSSLVLAC